MLGGYEGRTYTNSLDAFMFNKSMQHKVFEFDLSVTTDNIVVAAHDWDAFDGKTGFNGIPSYEEFKNILIEKNIKL